MPELPEVETVRRGLEKAGFRGPIQSVWRSSLPLRTGAHWSRSQEQLRCLKEALPQAVKRRGKHLIWEFLSAEGVELALLVHLGMSGRCEIRKRSEAKEAHTHFVLRFADDREFRFVDPRRFGGLRAGTRQVIYEQPPINRLGPEPLDNSFTGKFLCARAGRRKGPLREVLLDQKVVAGIGNIYALEALFLAKLHPLRSAETLDLDDWDRLAKKLKVVLKQGLKNGGTTLSDYRQADGRKGNNQRTLKVYGRAGQSCRSCGAVLEAYTHAGRGGVYCPEEQL